MLCGGEGSGGSLLASHTFRSQSKGAPRPERSRTHPVPVCCELRCPILSPFCAADMVSGGRPERVVAWPCRPRAVQRSEAQCFTCHLFWHERYRRGLICLLKYHYSFSLTIQKINPRKNGTYCNVCVFVCACVYACVWLHMFRIWLISYNLYFVAVSLRMGARCVGRAASRNPEASYGADGRSEMWMRSGVKGHYCWESRALRLAFIFSSRLARWLLLASTSSILSSADRSCARGKRGRWGCEKTNQI